MNLPRQKYDPAAILAANPIEIVVQQRGNIALKARGREFVALCPFHSERTPSFQVIPAEADQSGKGFFHCKGCGVSGDAIGFIEKLYGVGFVDACAILGGVEGGTCTIAPRAPLPPAPDPYAGLVALSVPSDPIRPGQGVALWNSKRLFDPKPKPIWNARPSAVYAYRGPGGALFGYVLRIDKPDGGKITPTIRYAQCHDGKARWAVWHFDPPRPLYRREIWVNKTGPIWIVEGERSTDAAAVLLGGLAATWPGGTNGVKYADWSQLAGRDLYLWPDADQEGVDAMLGKPAAGDDAAKPGVAELATAAGAHVRSVVEWDRDKPKGWDAADALRDGWTRADAMVWLEPRLRPYESAGARRAAQ